MERPSLLLIAPSALLPLDMASKVRVSNILKAATKDFDVTFLAICETTEVIRNKEYVKSLGVDHSIFLPALNRKYFFSRYAYGLFFILTNFFFGTPSHLFYAGMTNLSAKRISKFLNVNKFDIVLFEYWFSSSGEYFQRLGIPCALDLHDILWMKMKTSNNSKQYKLFTRIHRNFLINKYRLYEENTWQRFPHLISINYEETSYLKKKINPTTSIIDAGTGVDLDMWPYCWAPSKPPIIIFYGSLSGIENEEAALRCAHRIMPTVWSKVPNAELWLVGANPTRRLQDLTNNPHIKVTGFVEDVQPVLSKATTLLCPLTGRYGFRSRLIEGMALGVPLCVTPDAVYGMGIEDGKGVFIHDNDKELAENIVRLAYDRDYACRQSTLARKEVVGKFSFDATYGMIVKHLLSCIRKKEG